MYVHGHDESTILFYIIYYRYNRYTDKLELYVTSFDHKMRQQLRDKCR